MQSVRAQGEHVYIRVAYGTSKLQKPQGIGLYIANFADMQAMNLAQSTFFNLQRTYNAPWAGEWFGDANHSPIIGRLTPEYCDRLAMLAPHLRKT